MALFFLPTLYIASYFFEKDVAWYVRWTFQREPLDEVREDGVEAGPMSVEEEFEALVDPVGGSLGRVAEERCRVTVERRRRRLVNQSANVDSQPILDRFGLEPISTRFSIGPRSDGCRGRLQRLFVRL